MIGNTGRTFLLNGTDITHLVRTAAVVPLVKPPYGQLPTTAPVTLTVRSDGFQFHRTHPVSILYGQKLDDMDLVIQQGGFTRWAGKLSDCRVAVDGRTAEITAETHLMSRLSRAGRVDTDALTPTEAAARLLALYGIEIDEPSFAIANDMLDDIPVTVRVQPSVLTWDGTLGDILQLLASAGTCRFHVLPSGLVGVDVWEPPETYVLPAGTLRDRDIMNPIAIEYEDADPVDGYSIQWQHGTETTAETADVLSLDFGVNSAVVMQSLAGVIFAGTRWQDYHSRRRTVLRVPIRREAGIALVAERWIRLESALLGLSLQAEIVGWDDTDARWVTLTLHTDDELPR